MGETREEVSEALQDLHDAGCELITITQYLRPSPRHHPVERWVKPEEFVELTEEAEEIGFAGVHERPAGAVVATAPGGCTSRRSRAAPRPDPDDRRADVHLPAHDHAAWTVDGDAPGGAAVPHSPRCRSC